MFWRLLSLTLAVAICAPGPLPATASPAKLHEALPADSIERNGEPQPIVEHLHARERIRSILPPGELHPDAQKGVSKVYSGTPIDVIGYHYDAMRTGWNQSETDLTPASVATGGFGQIATLKVDGTVLAQPLIVSNFGMPDGKPHNLLIVATEHNSVYAYDAQTYGLLWQTNLGQAQSADDVGCHDLKPEFGISSTPVIVRTGPGQGRIYLVAASEPAPFSFHTKLHVLDLRTGKNLLTPVEISVSAKMADGHTVSYDPQNQWSRAGLVYANNSFYVAIASHCDHNAANISGWILRYDANLKLMRAFHTIDAVAGYQLSTIWMSGFAPSIDSAGNIYAVTGNGNFSLAQRQKGFGQSVLALSKDLSSVLGFFTPANYNGLNDNDDDFGAGGVMLLPTIGGQQAPPLAVAMGKSSIMYLLNQRALGGLENRIGMGALQQQTVRGGGVWGGPAYYNGPKGPMVYYQSGWDLLHAFKLDPSSSPTLSDVAVGASYGGFGGSTPIVSSNGATPGTGVVWVVCRGNPVLLEAYDALKLGPPIVQIPAGAWNISWGNALVTPLEANGRVYVPAYKTVTVFGLTQ